MFLSVLELLGKNYSPLFKETAEKLKVRSRLSALAEPIPTLLIDSSHAVLAQR